MAKKRIKFALKLKEGVEARNLQELREAFDLNQIIAYLLDGKLETWLLDRYYEDLVEKISNLDKSDPELRKKLCEIFEVEYEDDSLSIEEIEERNRRIKKLKEITDDEEIIKNVDKVAFSQEELADLLDDGQKTIYLCGTGFHIPASKKGIRYIGVETKLDITEEEREKYEANDIELIDLFDTFEEKIGGFVSGIMNSDDCGDNQTADYVMNDNVSDIVSEPVTSYDSSVVDEPEQGIYVTLNGKKTWVPYSEGGRSVSAVWLVMVHLGYMWADVKVIRNGKVITLPFYDLSEGDVIEVIPKK